MPSLRHAFAAIPIVVSLAGAPAALAHGRPAHAADPTAPVAHADTYTTPATGTLAVRRADGVLADDGGGPLQIVAHTDPAHGSVTLRPNGAVRYVPELGFTGTDSFTYTVSNAVSLHTTHLPPLASIGGVSLSGGAYGSSLYPRPGHPGEYYGLEDRGPNVSAPNGDDVLPLPSFDPGIGLFRFADDGRAVLIRRIRLRDAGGHPYSGLVNSGNATGETMEDLSGRTLATDPDGYDPEGLVAMPNGTFWVSDEYGPYITHFDARGRAIARLSPLDATLPRELAKRVPNKGMEGLTITPDGRTLVGAMQSALQQTDLNGKKATNVVPTRIVTYDLRTHRQHEYLYLLHDPKQTGTAVSEITALSNHTFLVDERDGAFPAAGGYKKLWKIDTAGATDVGPHATVRGARYDGFNGGLLVGGTTLEQLTQGEDTDEAAATLHAAHITPVSETPYLDVDALLLSLDPHGGFFSHDKLEGVAASRNGRRLVISNDSDFGIDGVTGDAAPWQLHPKTSPATGRQDDGEYLSIDMDRLDPATSAAQTSTATVTIHVGG